jgi:hypothetical protein
VVLVYILDDFISGHGNETQLITYQSRNLMYISKNYPRAKEFMLTQGVASRR